MSGFVDSTGSTLSQNIIHGVDIVLSTAELGHTSHCEALLNLLIYPIINYHM